MLNHLLEDGAVHGAPLSTQTVHYLHALLGRALNQALKWGAVTRNVADIGWRRSHPWLCWSGYAKASR
jgi:hypothetical protein